MHSEHGNGSRGRLDPRVLRELQPVAKLREAGWQLPATVPSSQLVRVMDTRLDPVWRARLVQALGLGIPTEGVYTVGGDFATQPYRDDAEALGERLTRWGPGRSGPYHLVVPPRPHVSRWLERARQQLPLEDAGAAITVCAVAKRNGCAPSMDVTELRRWLPWAADTLDDPKVQVSVAAVGERPLVLRLPEGGRSLPPSPWETTRLDADRILVAITLTRCTSERLPVAFHWVLGSPPPPTQPTGEELEMLRVDLDNLPGARHDAAQKAISAGLRRVAAALSLRVPVGHHLRQVAVQPSGEVTGIVSVPRETALQWLRGSGQGGIYLRPLWTERTAAALQRDRFRLLWLRGQRTEGTFLWDKLHAEDGFMGLVVEGKDVAVRVDATVPTTALEAQAASYLKERLKLQKDFVVRQATPGQRWWRLGPLTEAECFRAADIAASMGLEPLRGSAGIRFGRLGPFRSSAYFAAVGKPRCYSLDDGSWGASRAVLRPADPPPRHNTAARRPAPPASSQPALTPQSTWAGPRQPATSAPPPARPPPPAPRPPPAPEVRQPRPKPQPQPGPSPPVPAPRARAKARPVRSLEFTDATFGAPPAGGLQEVLEALRAELGELRQMNNALRDEMREVRRENAVLRDKLEEAGGRHVHRPYALAEPPAGPLPAAAPKRALEELEDGVPLSPLATTSGLRDADLDMSPGGHPPDQKRVRAPGESSGHDGL
jgi:hypothetical protein